MWMKFCEIIDGHQWLTANNRFDCASLEAFTEITANPRFDIVVLCSRFELLIVRNKPNCSCWRWFWEDYMAIQWEMEQFVGTHYSTHSIRHGSTLSRNQSKTVNWMEKICWKIFRIPGCARVHHSSANAPSGVAAKQPILPNRRYLFSRFVNLMKLMKSVGFVDGFVDRIQWAQQIGFDSIQLHFHATDITFILFFFRECVMDEKCCKWILWFDGLIGWIRWRVYFYLFAITQ